MKRKSHTLPSVLTPVAALAIAASAPTMLAGEAAGFVTRSVVKCNGTQDRAEAIVRCIGQIVRKLTFVNPGPCVVAASWYGADEPDARSADLSCCGFVLVDSAPHPLLIDTPPPTL